MVSRQGRPLGKRWNAGARQKSRPKPSGQSAERDQKRTCVPSLVFPGALTAPVITTGILTAVLNRRKGRKGGRKAFHVSEMFRQRDTQTTKLTNANTHKHHKKRIHTKHTQTTNDAYRKY